MGGAISPDYDQQGTGVSRAEWLALRKACPSLKSPGDFERKNSGERRKRNKPKKRGRGRPALDECHRRDCDFNIKLTWTEFLQIKRMALRVGAPVRILARRLLLAQA